MNRFAAGALAGLLATAPMTAAMLAFFRRLPEEEQYPLPPAEITMTVAEATGVDEHLHNEAERLEATLAAHFGYGAAAGLAYAPLAPKIPLLPPLIKGSLYGLTVWTVSYLGLLPAARILTPATEHPARRNALMIASNVLWGAMTALLMERFTGKDTSVTEP